MASVFKVVGVNNWWSLFWLVVALGSDQFGSAGLDYRPTWVIGADLGQLRFGGRRPPALMFGGGRRSAAIGGDLGDRRRSAVNGRRSAALLFGGRLLAVVSSVVVAFSLATSHLTVPHISKRWHAKRSCLTVAMCCLRCLQAALSLHMLLTKGKIECKIWMVKTSTPSQVQWLRWKSSAVRGCMGCCQPCLQEPGASIVRFCTRLEYRNARTNTYTTMQPRAVSTSPHGIQQAWLVDIDPKAA